VSENVLRCRWLSGTTKSKHSRRIVPTRHSYAALAVGTCGGVRNTRTSIVAVELVFSHLLEQALSLVQNASLSRFDNDFGIGQKHFRSAACPVFGNDRLTIRGEIPSLWSIMESSRAIPQNPTSKEGRALHSWCIQD
jgi:hypothetical protein